MHVVGYVEFQIGRLSRKSNFQVTGQRNLPWHIYIYRPHSIIEQRRLFILSFLCKTLVLASRVRASTILFHSSFMQSTFKIEVSRSSPRMSGEELHQKQHPAGPAWAR
jgi:hypothetical protein